MRIFRRAVHIGLSPNISFVDTWTAFQTLVQPWKWSSDEAIRNVEDWFKKYFSTETAASFDAGRSALRAILDCLELPAGSEVLTQALTCVAVPNSIMGAKLVPVYVDVDENFNIDIADAKNKLSSLTKVLIVQHTFGMPGSLDKISSFCKKNNLILLENCAHAFGATYKGKKIGTFGEAAFFSFGRDKIISSVWGGMAITNNNRLGKKLVQYQNELKNPSIIWIIQQLLHPIITYISLYTYNFFSLGKLILWISQKLHLITKPVTNEETSGKQVMTIHKKVPGALAILLQVQLGKLEKMNKTRTLMSAKWSKAFENSKFTLPTSSVGSVPLRYTIVSDRADEIRFKAKKSGFVLGNWYQQVVDPIKTDLNQIRYLPNSCPKAESIAGCCINLPTYPLLASEQITKIVNIFTSI